MKIGRINLRFGSSLSDSDHRSFGLFLIVLSLIGLFASFALTMEKIELLKNPDHVTSCTVNPVVACSPIITSNQASAFGFPNPFIGIFGFACVLTLGMSLLAGFRTREKWYWLLYIIGTAFGFGFCLWLMHEALFEIGKLCLYCMVVWLVSTAIFFTSLSYLGRLGVLKFKGLAQKIFVDNYFRVIALIYVSIALLILFRWWDFWFK